MRMKEFSLLVLIAVIFAAITICVFPVLLMAPAAADPAVGEAEFIVQAANAATRRSLTPVESAWLARSYGHHDETYRMARELMEFGIIHQNPTSWDSRTIALAYQVFTACGRRDIELARNILRAIPAAGPAGPAGRDGKDGKDGAPGAPGAAGKSGKDAEPLEPVVIVQPAPPAPVPSTPPPTPGVGGVPSVVQVTFIPARLTMSQPAAAQAVLIERRSPCEWLALPLAALLGRPRYNSVTTWSPSIAATTGAVTATGGAGGQGGVGGAGYGAAAVASTSASTSTAVTPTSAAHAEQSSASSAAPGAN